MFFKHNDISIYYEVHGNKKDTILILPGWGNTRSSFYNLINYFKNNYTIYIIDYPSFGNSPIPNKELTIYDYADLIYHFIKKEEINPIIIAHSFGGRISAILIGKYNLKIEKLVLMDVAGIKRFNLKVFIKQKIYKLLKKLTYLLPKIKQEYFRNKLLLLFGSIDYQNIPVVMQKTFKNIINEDLKKYYKNITTNTLIIWGEKDIDTPLKDAYFLKKNIKDSGLIIYENSRHFSYLDKLYLTNLIINEFIKR